jgi:hypothetical protein
MVKVNGVDQPINLAISFAQDEIIQIQGHRWVRKALIALGHSFPRKRLQIGSLSRILYHEAFLLTLGTTEGLSDPRSGPKRTKKPLMPLIPLKAL